MRIVHVSFEEPYEAEGFIDEDGKILAAWDNNDACWRGEYMNPLLEKLGITVIPARNNTVLRRRILRYMNGDF